MSKTILSLTLLFLGLSSSAQTKLDTSFSNDGIVVHTKYNATQIHPTQVDRMLVMPDSTILLGCQTNQNPDMPIGISGFILCRLDKKGNILDTVTNQYSIYYKGYRYVMPPNNLSADMNGTRDMGLLPDGKILFTGSVLNSAGIPFATTFRINYPSLALDTTYGIKGMGQLWQNTPHIAERTAIAADGSSYTISNYLYTDSLFAFVVKRRPNGLLDSSWQQNGVFLYINQKGGQFQDIKVASNGSIYIAGMYKDASTLFHATLLKLNANGSRDAAYGANGIAEGEYVANHVIVNSDGSAYLGGSDLFSPTFYSDYVIKFTPTGQRDATFATNGLYSYSTPFIARDMIGQADNKLLLVGSQSAGSDSSWIAVSRMMPNGKLDTSFGDHGMYELHQLLPSSTKTRYANCGILQPDGKLLVGGGCATSNSPEMMVIRLTNKIDTASPAPTRVTQTVANGFSYSVSPIPATEVLRIHYSLTKSDRITYSITDENGRMMHSGYLGGNTPGTYNHVINIADLAAGFYVLNVGNTISQHTKISIVR